MSFSDKLNVGAICHPMNEPFVLGAKANGEKLNENN